MITTGNRGLECQACECVQNEEAKLQAENKRLRELLARAVPYIENALTYSGDSYEFQYLNEIKKKSGEK